VSKSSAKTIKAPEVHVAISRLASVIAEHHRATEQIWLLGIANGGIKLAYRLAELINKSNKAIPNHAKAGTLDISFHRDDLGRHPIPKEFIATSIPGDVTGATIILVDDVLFTGRTVKASLDELFDHGRPALVELAVLVDRGGRRLPVTCNYAGITLGTHFKNRVNVTLCDNPKLDNITIHTE
jgi:pyrimidine operon attenuation protein/uracil phosphoribosyltransferase